MGADFAVFGDGDVVSATFAEAGDVDGGVEFAELADFLEVLVHLLVGDDGKGQVSGEILVFVFVQEKNERKNRNTTQSNRPPSVLEGRRCRNFLELG